MQVTASCLCADQCFETKLRFLARPPHFSEYNLATDHPTSTLVKLQRAQLKPPRCHQVRLFPPDHSLTVASSRVCRMQYTMVASRLGFKLLPLNPSLGHR